MNNLPNFDVVVALPRNCGIEEEQPKQNHNGVKCEEVSFTCHYCDKLFFEKCELTTHILHHMKNDTKLKCHLCNIGFSRKTYLTEHYCTHNGEKPHACYYCGKTFSMRCNLIRHVRIHTGEKRFSCNQCDRSFILKKNLIEHQRTHTGEKPFKCTSCDWTFGRRSSLVRHIRTHTGEKKYECSLCNKSFAWKYYLQRHMQVHLNDKVKRRSSEDGPARSTRKRRKAVDYVLEKPNTCDHCGLSFKSKKTLQKHSEQHNEDYVLVSRKFYVSDSVSVVIPFYLCVC